MIVMNTNKNHLRTMFYALNKLSKGYTDEEKKMNYECAKEMRMLLVQNIMSEKYSGAYEDLAPFYKKWKSQHGGLNGFWQLWGSLINAITVRETPKGFSVGIEKNVLPTKTSSIINQNTLTPVWKYAWYGEYGYTERRVGFLVRSQHPRPVFRPTQAEYKLEFWKKRGQESLNRIKGLW